MPPHPANFLFLVEMGFHHVGQAGLELLTLGDPPASASQSAGITGMRHSTWPRSPFFSRTYITKKWEKRRQLLNRSLNQMKTNSSQDLCNCSTC
uniref:Uncharacterized protein n=1 Tax=Pongo abelii TaxID=9601 RepID=A0A8I5YNP5_PONAB